MAGAAELTELIVGTALAFVPALRTIPVLGRLLQLLAPAGGNDFEAIEQLERNAQERKTERKTRIERNARYVLKASDAMQCVEDNLMHGAFLFALGRGLVNIILNRDGSISATEILLDRIFACIESKTLAQTGKRVKKEVKYYGRPAKGHGHGRTADIS